MIVDIAAIKQSVSEASGVSVPDLEGNEKRVRVSSERHKAIYLCAKYTRIELDDLGRWFGQRQRQSVDYAIDKIERQLQFDRRLRKELDAIHARASEIYVSRLMDPVASVSESIVNGVVDRMTMLMLASKPGLAAPPTAARLDLAIKKVLAAKRTFDTDRYTRGENHALTRLITALGELGPAFSEWSDTLSKHQHGETP